MPTLLLSAMAPRKHLTSVERGAHPVKELINYVHSYVNKRVYDCCLGGGQELV